ncbi:hypothetical protein CASFOL_009097 [Castilleja foliolosa]|uniref:Uncharacterized protein n=1 Tax=Castilleja foliolosa TaxID=1961234 RepID=A0ABD3E4X7_9LAMI
MKLKARFVVQSAQTHYSHSDLCVLTKSRRRHLFSTPFSIS